MSIYSPVLVKKILIQLPVAFMYKVNRVSQSYFDFLHASYTVVKLIQFLIEWHKGLDAHTAE